jgi:hypothetical protein
MNQTHHGLVGKGDLAMISLKSRGRSHLEQLYDRLPSWAHTIYRQLAWKSEALRWHLSPEKLALSRCVESLRNRYAGQRCVIMGNGPSLKNTDWQLLRNEFTFGLNRIYLLFEEMGFSPNFLVCINPLVLKQSVNEISRVESLKFLDWGARKRYQGAQRTLFLPSRPDLEFCTDISCGCAAGFTVTFAAMQIAYYLGFTKVILIGVDHSFVTKGKPNAVVLTAHEDPNHFSPHYFGQGTKWQLPDLEGSERAYRTAQRVYLNDNREILDATRGGKLTIFPKVDLQQVLI